MVHSDFNSVAVKCSIIFKCMIVLHACIFSCVYRARVCVCLGVPCVTLSGCVDHSHHALCGLDCAAAPRSHPAWSH